LNLQFKNNSSRGLIKDINISKNAGIKELKYVYEK